MSQQQFQATVEKNGSAVSVSLPFDPNEVWGAKDRHHVAGTINGYPVRGPLKQTDAGYQLSLGAAWQRDAKITAGMSVDVVLAPEGPQLSALSPDFVAALAASPAAQSFFEGLATFYRKGYLRWIDGARKPEVRAERIADVIRLLEAGRKEREK